MQWEGKRNLVINWAWSLPSSYSPSLRSSHVWRHEILLKPIVKPKQPDPFKYWQNKSVAAVPQWLSCILSH